MSGVGWSIVQFGYELGLTDDELLRTCRAKMWGNAPGRLVRYVVDVTGGGYEDLAWVDECFDFSAERKIDKLRSEVGELQNTCRAMRMAWLRTLETSQDAPWLRRLRNRARKKCRVASRRLRELIVANEAAYKSAEEIMRVALLRAAANKAPKVSPRAQRLCAAFRYVVPGEK